MAGRRGGARPTRSDADGRGYQRPVRFRAEVEQAGRTATGITVPDDCAAALAARPAARAFFDGLAPGQRKAFGTPITGAKAPQTRRRRIDKAVAALVEGKKRV